MSILQVSHLTKRYPTFTLEDISFSLAEGQITGFIGRNGAGKSTTIKSMLGFVHADAGDIAFFGQPFIGHETSTKQEIGVVLGGIDYYPKKKLRTITKVTRSFYPNWDAGAYVRYMKAFSLDENKTPSELSAGMRVKYALALALSHEAKLLILDEPTSGLDPVSREELLDIFLALREKGITILFSTHITSDLDKCADRILYIKEGRLIADAPMDDFTAQYRLLHWREGISIKAFEDTLLGIRRSRDGYSGLIEQRILPAQLPEGVDVAPADLEEIMVHIEKEELTL